MKLQFPEIILATQSPRRKQIFADCGFQFSAVSLEVDESFPPKLIDSEVCIYLAEKKADAYQLPLQDKILVTADTIVSVENTILNKPENRQEAIEMLQKINGKMHIVFTGVCIRTASIKRVFYDNTEVYFNLLTRQEIEYYVDNFKPFDKAGSYGVQEWIGYIGIEKIVGCFYNVMGFPMAKFYQELKMI